MKTEKEIRAEISQLKILAKYNSSLSQSFAQNLIKTLEELITLRQNYRKLYKELSNGN